MIGAGLFRRAPVLMFGLGATRTGTSWLNDYLSRHPQCSMREIKEAHYFDAIERGSVDFQLRQLADRRAMLSARLAEQRSAADRARLERGIAAHDELIALLDARDWNDAAYLAYLTRNAGRARLVGDITPAYALLSAETLRRMAGLAEKVRFVYILRDPVQRLWSNIRQTLPMRSAARNDPERAALRIFDRWAEGGERELALRCDYRGALERMGQAIPAGHLLVLFFETLFSAETLTRLCRFLGIRAVPGNTGRRVHAAEPLPLDPARLELARARLAPQYDYVRDRFGTLPPGWDAPVMKV